MQVAASPYPASQPLYPYPNHYHHHHHPIPVAHDHELKRQYLGLLPPQQIIEICLTFDVHVPPYVKAGIWPLDLSAAITGLRKQAADAAAAAEAEEAASASTSASTSTSSTVPQEAEGQKENGNGGSEGKTSPEEGGIGEGQEEAIMDSLTADSPARPSPVPEEEGGQSKEGVEEPRPPDKDAATTEEQASKETTTTTDFPIPTEAPSNPDGPTTTENEIPSTNSTSNATSASTSTPKHTPGPTTTTNGTTDLAATAAPAAPTHPSIHPPAAPVAAAAATPAVPPPHQVQPIPVAYPHQPYGYPYAPYYPPPPPGYPYPHHQYAAYPHQPAHAPPHAYPPPPPQTALAPVPPPPAPPMPLIQQQHQEGQSPDDLPSYEEMIVEALMDTNDPEGCAPKDLFTWMAARYPVQSNFRPSASQALQKAYKRGRLEKSSNNKYRLNAAWEGGNTSRRTTRRPQTHTHTLTSQNNAAPSSPFTNAPLVHHHHPQQQQQQHQPYGYSAYPYPPYSNYNNTAQQQATAAAAAAPASQPQQPAPAAAATTTTTNTAAASTDASKATTVDAQDKDVTDAYEAAQSILKAINFGSLLQLPAEETQEGAAAQSPPSQQPSVPGTLGYQHPQVASTQHQQTAQHQPHTLLAALNAQQQLHQKAVGVAPSQQQQHHLGAPSEAVATGTRADLQAQLALLAAQLAELARVDEGRGDVGAPALAGLGQGAVQVPPVPQQHQPLQHQQPVRGLFYPQPNVPQQQQMQGQTPMHISPYAQPPQTQPQPPHQPTQVSQDAQAPMAALLPPPPPPPPVTAVVEPTPATLQSALSQAQVQQQALSATARTVTTTMNINGAPYPYRNFGLTGWTGSGVSQPKQATSSDAVAGAEPVQPPAQQQYLQVPQQGDHSMQEAPVLPALVPMEPMDDSALDGEYDSDDDDDDMEEVI